MRQETDTIDIIDDLRYAINDAGSSIYPVSINELINNQEKTNKKDSFQILIEQEKKLHLIDKILKELNLEC